MGSRRWPGSIPRAARPAAPGSPPPPSGSPGGAQGRLGQGLPRGSAASALMNTSRGASVLRGLCPKDGTAALSPYPHLHALPHRCAHLEGNPRAITLLQIPASHGASGMGPRTCAHITWGLIVPPFPSLGEAPDPVCLTTFPGEDTQAASPQTTFFIGRTWSDPVQQKPHT